MSPGPNLIKVVAANLDTYLCQVNGVRLLNKHFNFDRIKPGNDFFPHIDFAIGRLNNHTQ